jgi:hypothetical protein
VTFLIDNRKFAIEYWNWIQQNEESLIKAAAADTKQKISVFDVKMYSNMFKEIIKERLSYVNNKCYDVGKKQSNLHRICLIYF